MAEIAELREKYPLLVVMRDNSVKTNPKNFQTNSHQWELKIIITPLMNHGKMDWLVLLLNQ